MRARLHLVMAPLVAIGIFVWMATSAQAQGECHAAIYKEFQFGFGSDIRYQGIVYKSAAERLLGLPPEVAGK